MYSIRRSAVTVSVSAPESFQWREPNPSERSCRLVVPYKVTEGAHPGEGAKKRDLSCSSDLAYQSQDVEDAILSPYKLGNSTGA